MVAGSDPTYPSGFKCELEQKKFTSKVDEVVGKIGCSGIGTKIRSLVFTGAGRLLHGIENSLPV